MQGRGASQRLGPAWDSRSLGAAFSWVGDLVIFQQWVHLKSSLLHSLELVGVSVPLCVCTLVCWGGLTYNIPSKLPREEKNGLVRNMRCHPSTRNQLH